MKPCHPLEAAPKEIEHEIRSKGPTLIASYLLKNSLLLHTLRIIEYVSLRDGNSMERLYRFEMLPTRYLLLNSSTRAQQGNEAAPYNSRGFK